jgi:hypothetical protein
MSHGVEGGDAETFVGQRVTTTPSHSLLTPG